MSIIIFRRNELSLTVATCAIKLLFTYRRYISFSVSQWVKPWGLHLLTRKFTSHLNKLFQAVTCQGRRGPTYCSNNPWVPRHRHCQQDGLVYLEGLCFIRIQFTVNKFSPFPMCYCVLLCHFELVKHEINYITVH